VRTTIHGEAWTIASPAYPFRCLSGAGRLPTLQKVRGFVEDEGLVTYGVSIADLWRRAATYIDKILKGAPSLLTSPSSSRRSSNSS